MSDMGFDAIKLEIEASAEKAMPQLDSLIGKLEGLSNVLSGLNKNANIDFSKMVSQLNAISKINVGGKSGGMFGSIQTGIKGVARLVSPFEKLVFKAGNATKNAFGTVATASINGMIASVRKVSSAFKGMGSILSSTFSKMKAGLSGVVAGLKAFVSPAISVSQKAQGMFRTFASLYAKIWSIKKIIGFLKESATSAMAFIETFHYFDEAFKKVGADTKANWRELGYESAEEYANSFRDRALEVTKKMSGYSIDASGKAVPAKEPSLGINPEMLMGYQAQFAQMANGMGMTSEAAEMTSRALTKLGADWSSLRNIAFNTSYEKLASALAGQSRAVRSLGIDITQATLSQYAMNAGIETSVTQMTQAEKAELRMIAILDQSKVAWGDMAATLETPANQYRLLQQNIASLARTLGSIFVPILKTVLPYINGVVIALRSLVEWIARLVGADISEASTGIGSISDAFVEMPDTDFDTDGIDGIADASDDAAEAAEELEEELDKVKRVLFGFDEMNILPGGEEEEEEEEAKPDGSNTGSGTIGNIGDTQKLDSYLGKLLDEYELKWQAAFDAMSNKAQEIADKIIDAFKSKDWEGLGRTIANLLASGINSINELLDPGTLFPKIEAVTDGISGTLNGFFDPNNSLWTELGSLFAKAINAIAKFANDFFNKTDFENIGRSVAKVLKQALEEIDAEELGKAIGNKIKAGIDFLVGFLEEMEGSWGKLGTKFGELVLGALSVIDGKDIAHIINLAVDGAKDFLEATPWDKLGAAIGDKADEIIDNLDTKNMGKLLATAINSAVKFAKGFMDETKGDWDAWGTKIGELMNGMVENIDTASMGSTLANAVNMVFSIIRNAVNTFDWDSLSQKMSTGINSLISTTEWTNAGKTIGELVSKMLGSISNTIKGIHWRTLGREIGNGLSTMTESIPTEKPGQTVSDVMYALLGFLKSGLNKFRTEGGFSNIGKMVGELLNAVFADKKKWEELGDTLESAMKGALEFLKVTRETIDWDSIATNIHDFIMGALDGKNSLWEEAFEELSDWIGQLHKFIIKALPTKEEFMQIASNIKNKISQVINDDELWEKAFKALGDFVGGLADFLVELLPNEEGWKKIGTRIGEAIEAIPWDTVVTDIVTEIGNVFKGLGDTLAGKIILGITLAKVTYTLLSPFFTNTKSVIVGAEAIKLISGAAKKLLVGSLTAAGELIGSLAKNTGITTFVKNIGTAISGKTSTIAGTISSLLSDAFDSGASTASETIGTSSGITTFTSAVSGVLGMSGLITGAVSAATELQKASERAQGLNGELTAAGTALKNLTDHAITNAGPIKQLTDDQKQAILELNDEMETSGTDAETMTTNMSSLLSSFGYTAEDIETLWSETSSGINTTKEQMDFMAGVIEKMPDVVEAANTRIDLSNVTSRDAVRDLTDAWENNRSTIGLTGDAFANLEIAMATVSGESLTAEEAYDKLKTKCEELNVPVDALNELFGIAFPEAVSTGMTSATDSASTGATSIKDSTSKISGAVSSMATDTSASAKSAGDSLKSNLKSASTDSQSSIAALATNAAADFSKMAQNANKESGNVKNDISNNTSAAKSDSVKYTEEMKSQVSGKYKEMSRDANTEFAGLKDKVVSQMGKIKTDTNTKMDELSKYLHDRFKNLASHLPDHFKNIGEDIGKHFDQVDEKVGDHVNSSEIDKFFKNLNKSITDAFNNVSSDIGKKFSDTDQSIKGKVKDNEIKKFFSGIAKTAVDVFDGVDSDIGKKFSNVHTKISNNTETWTIKNNFTSLKNDCIDAFDGVSQDIGSKFQNVHDDIWRNIDTWSIQGTGESIVRALQTGMDRISLSLPHISWTWDTVEYGPADNRQWFQVPSLSVSWYAKGGFPNFGELFIANENGPELVGSMGNRNVVANNKQITDGIRAAAFEGFVNAFEATIGNGNTQSDRPVFNVYVGGEKVTDVVIKDINHRTLTNGVSPLVI